MNKVIKRFENLMLCSLTMPIIDVIVGLIFMICSDFHTKENVVILCSFLLVQGIFYIIRYLYDGLGKKVFAIDLIIGVATTILGGFGFIYLLNNIDKAANLLGIFFGVWILLVAVEKIYFGAKFVKAGEEIYPLVCFISVLFVVIAILVMTNPFDSFMYITRLIGLFLICTGLLDAMTCMLFRRRTKEILKLFK